MFNNFQDTVLTPSIVASMANIVVKNVMMKEEPNLVSYNLKFYVIVAESSFIDLCDSFNKDDPSFFDVVAPLCMNSQPTKE